MSWQSSALYYRLINEEVAARLGGLHSADLVLRSVDFVEIEQFQLAGRWDLAGEKLASDARALVAAGAEILLLCANTMHKVADAMTAELEIPFVHIADACAEAINAAGVASVALLATTYTMEEDFYVGRLRERHGLGVLIPNDSDRLLVNRVIFEELIPGAIEERSRRAYQAVIADLVERGAEGILLGCTEIGLLIGPEDVSVPLFDSARLHAHKAVELALA
jgi:aspartate racemase